MKTPETYTEHQLLIQIGQGDHGAFKRLFLAYRQQIYTAAIRITGDEILAEDIYQDVFLTVWLRRESLVQIDNFPGWLFTVARNKLYDAVKRITANKTDRLDFIHDIRDDNNISQEEQLHTKRIREILHKAVLQLPDKQRQVYLLIKKEHLTRDQAASRLRVAPETIKSNLDHAMRSIRAYCLSRIDSGLLFTLLIILK